MCMQRHQDHPRIRGVHLYMVSDTYIIGGSSPHTRGTLAPQAINAAISRIIPAYAGYTQKSPVFPGSFRDHPRIRGVHVARLASEAASQGSSPHTRGTQNMVVVAWPPCRIIPAYAGYTKHTAPTGGEREDHPRIRGVHLCLLESLSSLLGSSPHTRGTPAYCLGGPTPGRIIPAYAGYTLKKCPKYAILYGVTIPFHLTSKTPAVSRYNLLKPCVSVHPVQNALLRYSIYNWASPASFCVPSSIHQHKDSPA